MSSRAPPIKVHDHLESGVLVLYQRAGICRDKTLRMELAQRLHPCFEDLDGHPPVNGVEALDDPGLYGPLTREPFLKGSYPGLVLDEGTIFNPLPVDGMEIGAAEIAPVPRQILDWLPLACDGWTGTSRIVDHCYLRQRRVAALFALRKPYRSGACRIQDTSPLHARCAARPWRAGGGAPQSKALRTSASRRW